MKVRIPLGVLGFLLLTPVAARGAAPPVAIASPSTRAVPFPAPDRFMIQLRPQASRAAFALRAGAPARRTGLSAVDRIVAAIPGTWIEPEFRDDAPPTSDGGRDFAAFYVVHLAPDADIDAALARFRALPEVLDAHRIELCPVTEVPNDSLWSIAYYFDQPSGRDIHAVAAWDLTHGDTSTVVAVLDTGILPYHPDLAPFWTNAREANGLPGVDDDGNGYVDDIHGWDFVALGSAAYATPGEDWRDEDNDPNDFVGHGTTVAGLIGALNDNHIGIAGTAWNVRILPLRVGYSAPLAQTGVIDLSYVARALRYAARMGVDVINISFSNTWTAEFEWSVGAALDSGITVVVAAGNNGSPNAIADYFTGSAVFVAATDRNDVVPVWSNRASWVDLCAPGAEVATTVLSRPGADSLGLRQPSYVPDANGTSFSTPIVSGAVALLQGARRSQGLKAFDRRQVRTLLRYTTDDISAQNPGVTGYGSGRLDLERLIRYGLRVQAERLKRAIVGPGTEYATNDGRQFLAYATDDAHLLRLDAVSLDQIGLDPLPAPATGGIAAGDLGAERGLGLFVGCGSFLGGFGGGGAPLPGWPVRLPTGQVWRTPALGDLDGDGVPEVVATTTLGEVWAWTAGGMAVAGFPASLGAPVTLGAPPALADLDGNPGVEIVVAGSDGTVHAFGAGGAELPGWPAVTRDPAPAGPVISRRGSQTVIVVAGSSQTWGLASDGQVLFHLPRTPGICPDPALADLDGDGEDEVVVVTSAGVWGYHLDGTTFVGWPLIASFPSPGTPVIGRVDADASPDLLLPAAGTVIALDPAAARIADFPPYPTAAAFPMFAAGSPGRSRIVLGASVDATLYQFETPASLDTLRGWPVPRGNPARTGSRFYSPAQAAGDVIPPARVTDLRARAIGSGSSLLTWTSPSDAGPRGLSVEYSLRYSDRPISDADFAAARAVPLNAAPAAPGQPETVVITDVINSAGVYFALRSRDASGNWSAASNSARRVTLDPREFAIGGVNAFPLPSTGRLRFTLDLTWTAEYRIDLFDLSGRRVGTPATGLARAGRTQVEWNGLLDGRPVQNGVYFYLVTARSGSETRTLKGRAVLIR